jgi:hypothetical protein
MEQARSFGNPLFAGIAPSSLPLTHRFALSMTIPGNGSNNVGGDIDTHGSELASLWPLVEK